MVCGAGKPLRGRSTGPGPKRSEARDQVNGRAKEKKNRLQGGGGRTHNNCVERYELCHYMPPPGAGGGGEQSARARPERQRRDVSGQARAGGGVGHGTWVAQVLKVLTVCLLFLCPHRERGGAASRPAEHVPSASEGTCSDGRERGEGWGLGSAPWRHSTIMINSYLIERPMGASERSERRTP